ncbi:MAG: tRNA (adenosine(37)-N6)-dimethylallyltransferase MiaA [Ignavibacteriales bacterium]|nr:tRNA (adenosine(37)-N6)-dimethylallyltransferase MiaA [Ignavibacteriales bacterium]
MAGTDHRHAARILVIAGPTASGKTALALFIASRIPSEIISADSRQIFKHLTIGTAKPAMEELARVPHHFIDQLEPEEHFSAGDFQEQGRRVVQEVLSRSKLPMVVGGTGLYVRALIDGLFSGPGRVDSIREELEHRYESEGGAALLEELRNVDPAAAERMIPTQFRRIIRALEVYRATGKTITQHHKEQGESADLNAVFVGLRWKRSQLYTTINTRVERMMEAGFLDEVRHLRDLGYDDRLKALQTVGYKEAFQYLRGEIDRERMVELMKQNTRRYAKRQLTWFTHDKRIRWFDIEDERQIVEIGEVIVSELPNV